jgi:hypothetical protein
MVAYQTFGGFEVGFLGFSRLKGLISNPFNLENPKNPNSDRTAQLRLLI